jgi:hypothetical protein
MAPHTILLFVLVEQLRKNFGYLRPQKLTHSGLGNPNPESIQIYPNPESIQIYPNPESIQIYPDLDTDLEIFKSGFKF